MNPRHALAASLIALRHRRKDAPRWPPGGFVAFVGSFRRYLSNCH